MRVAIVGGRDFGLTPTEAEKMYAKLDQLRRAQIENEPELAWSVVISGGAKGADTIAQYWARKAGLPFVLFKPYHLIDKTVSYHPRYFFTRNKQIVDNSELVVAFWNGESSGTRHAIRYAKSAGKHVIVISHDDLQ